MRKGKPSLEKSKDTFVLYRVIGNDLYPRHKKGQTIENLQFILEHEKELEQCDKRWIVNRIIDPKDEEQILDLLRRHKQEFIHFPFVPKEYQKVQLDTDCLPEPGFLATDKFLQMEEEVRNRLIAATYRLKNNYVMNLNPARNAALRDGKKRARWVLPWDGNCFVTPNAWEKIRADVTASSGNKYFIVPMTRVLENKLLLKQDFAPNPVEEPQLVFRNDSREEFDESFYYGRRPKVEMFWRLGIPGPWDRWKDDPWDPVRRPLSKEAGQYGTAGWVARLFSGMKNLELDDRTSFKQRGILRLGGIISTIRHVDTLVSGKGTDRLALTVLHSGTLKREKADFLAGKHFSPVRKLLIDVDKAMGRGPYSVTDKTTLPPSGKAQDYWHPAPYWWPNPKTKDGLPYIQRDGIRVPGTEMYGKGSNKYDRTRLQYMFDDSLKLALAWYFTGNERYARHGIKLLEHFFLHPVTGMTPHLKYAQVRMGKNNNENPGTGIIEMKDMYYYLDAVRLFKSSGLLSKETSGLFKNWLSSYLDWLLESPQGRREFRAANNHGTYYDLQVLSIADFLQRDPLVFETIVRAQSRIARQFAVDGSQPEELRRATTAHYCCFNFQGWIHLAEICSRWGTDLWAFQASNGASLLKGAEWLLSHDPSKWPYQQLDEFDTDRFYPIWFAIPQAGLKVADSGRFLVSKGKVKAVFHPHDGVRPYWNIGLRQL